MVNKTDKYIYAFKIRHALLSDMPFFLSMAQQEGWNPGVNDAAPFYYTDPNGFFIGELDGEPIGCISAVAYSVNFGFIGFYIVKKEYRKRGFGSLMWVKALEHLQTCCIGLDGVVEQEENYKKSNFKFYYKNIRFEGLSNASLPENLIDLTVVPLKMVCDYDASVFGCCRKIFLEKWIAMPNAYKLGQISNNLLVGYGIIRSCVNGWKIGPLFADDEIIALNIYRGLCCQVSDAQIFWDIPESNNKAMEIAHKHAMKEKFQTVRMYNAPPPKSNLSHVFGVTTFELG